MPNDQQHDPRVSTESERLAVARTLSVAAIASSGAGGTPAFAYSAPDGIADGELITLTTDGSEGWDFGSAPSEVATMGFGQGLLYTENEGQTFRDHVDSFSGASWDWEFADFSVGRQIVTEAGLRALKTEDSPGGFVTYVFGSYVPENSKLFTSSISKSNYGFVNSYLTTPIEIASVSANQITLVDPWPDATDTVGSTLMMSASTTDSDAGHFKTGGTFTNGSTVVQVDGDPVAAGVQPGWFAGKSRLSQWKGVRVSDTGGFGSSSASPIPNDTYMTPVNSTDSGFRPDKGRWTTGQPSDSGGYPGDMWYKSWSRNDQQMKYGTFGNTDGELSGNMVTPDQSFVLYNDNVTTGRNLHDTNRRTGAVSWQEYTVGVLSPNLHRTDFFVQVGTFARVELSDGDSPSTATSSFILPPSVADWSSRSIKVLLWKSLFTDYSGKYLHFFDSEGLFRKAVAL